MRRGLSVATTPAWPALPPAPEPMVRADSLTQAEKRLVWEHIKKHDPNQRAFMEDPDITAFIARHTSADKKTVSAVHVFSKKLVDAALGRTKVTTP